MRKRVGKRGDSHDIIHGTSGITQYIITSFLIQERQENQGDLRRRQANSSTHHYISYSWEAGFRFYLYSLPRAAQKFLAIFSLIASLLALDRNMARAFCVALCT